MHVRELQRNKDSQNRYQNVDINNQRQDKKEYIADQIIRLLDIKENARTGFISIRSDQKK